MKPNKVICLFEQSGTFSGEFRKLGIPAYDVDIQQRSFQLDKKQRYVQKTNPTRKSAFRGKLRSEISPDYARNFILDKILGEVHRFTMPELFNN